MLVIINDLRPKSRWEKHLHYLLNPLERKAKKIANNSVLLGQASKCVHFKILVSKEKYLHFDKEILSRYIQQSGFQ